MLSVRTERMIDWEIDRGNQKELLAYITKIDGYEEMWTLIDRQCERERKLKDGNHSIRSEKV